MRTATAIQSLQCVHTLDIWTFDMNDPADRQDYYDKVDDPQWMRPR